MEWVEKESNGILLGKPSIASVQQILLLNWHKWRKIHIVLFAMFFSAANVTFEVH